MTAQSGEKDDLFERAGALVDFLSDVGAPRMCATVSLLCARICELEIELAAAQDAIAAFEADNEEGQGG